MSTNGERGEFIFLSSGICSDVSFNRLSSVILVSISSVNDDISRTNFGVKDSSLGSSVIFGLDMTS
jgi:hypothetical protein